MTRSIANGKKLNTKYFWCVFLLSSCICFLVLYSHYIILFTDNFYINFINPLHGMEDKNAKLDSFEIIANTARPGTDLEFRFNGNTESSILKHSKQKDKFDPCLGKYIYVHDLPRRFNDDIIKNCSHTRLYDICESISNYGLGPQLKAYDHGVFDSEGWYGTNQFALEVIFRQRMKQYKCLTNDSSIASAIYVPYYAGLDIARFRGGNYNTSIRDSNPVDLVKWLARKDEWKTMWGRDHFFLAGRITWDFRRPVDDDDSAWGNKLMLLPEAKNMTMLTIESSPSSNKDVAIPYPTNFHPSTDAEVFRWQSRMRRKKRQYLFSFIGAPRANMMQTPIRDEIISQCAASSEKFCKLVDCSLAQAQCRDLVFVMEVLQSSTFCLQPPGDSYTRQSIFLSIIAGCVPVFVHPGSVYGQYIWHLPKNHTEYSILIEEDDIWSRKFNIKKLLLAMPKDKVSAIRNQLIELIPRVVYANPRSKLGKFEDAFDVAVKGVIGRIEKIRRLMSSGKGFSLSEDDNWSYYLYGVGAEFPYDLLSPGIDNDKLA